MEPMFPIEQAKRCCTCKVTKSLDEFNRLKKARDGRQPSCRECNRAYHYANFDRRMTQIRNRNRRVLADGQALMLDYLRQHPCVDCGETDPVVLEFDHLRDKTRSVSDILYRRQSWAAVLAEIKKCDVVCANCHWRRTASRRRSHRWRETRG